MPMVMEKDDVMKTMARVGRQQRFWVDTIRYNPEGISLMFPSQSSFNEYQVIFVPVMKPMKKVRNAFACGRGVLRGKIDPAAPHDMKSIRENIRMNRGDYAV